MESHPNPDNMHPMYESYLVLDGHDLDMSQGDTPVVSLGANLTSRNLHPSSKVTLTTGLVQICRLLESVIVDSENDHCVNVESNPVQRLCKLCLRLAQSIVDRSTSHTENIILQLRHQLETMTEKLRTVNIPSRLNEDLHKTGDDDIHSGLGVLGQHTQHLQEELSSLYQQHEICTNRVRALRRRHTDAIRELQTTIARLTYTQERVLESLCVVEAATTEIKQLGVQASAHTITDAHSHRLPCSLAADSGSGRFAVINGHRLGANPEPKHNLNWSEINSAWSQMAVLVHLYMNRTQQLHTIELRIVPLRNLPYILHIASGKKFFLCQDSHNQQSTHRLTLGVLALCVCVSLMVVAPPEQVLLREAAEQFRRYLRSDQKNRALVYRALESMDVKLLGRCMTLELIRLSSRPQSTATPATATSAAAPHLQPSSAPLSISS